MQKKMMLKAAACGLALVGLAMVAGCGSSDKKADNAGKDAPKGKLLAQIKEKGKLVVGTASGFPPYEFIDTSKAEKTVVGIDIALAQKIADKIGVKLEVQDMNFSAILSSLAAGKVDIALSGITPTDERKKTVDFSDVYLNDQNIILVRKEDVGKYTKLSDFYGKKIAVQKSTQQEQLAKDNLKDAQVVSLDKVANALMELQQGKVEGVPAQKVVSAQYLITNPGIVDSGVIFEGTDSTSAVAIPKGNDDLVKIINEVIAESKKAGDFEKWTQEYAALAVANAQK